MEEILRRKKVVMPIYQMSLFLILLAWSITKLTIGEITEQTLTGISQE